MTEGTLTHPNSKGCASDSCHSLWMTPDFAATGLTDSKGATAPFQLLSKGGRLQDREVGTHSTLCKCPLTQVRAIQEHLGSSQNITAVSLLNICERSSWSTWKQLHCVNDCAQHNTSYRFRVPRDPQLLCIYYSVMHQRLLSNGGYLCGFLTTAAPALQPSVNHL